MSTQTEIHTTKSSGSAPLSCAVAWVGWQTRVPADWRLLHIGGDWNRGDAMLGTASDALLQIRWWRPRERNLNFDRWLQQRLRTAVSRRAAVSNLDHAPAGLAKLVAVVEDAPKRGPAELMWYGFAPGANLVIELTTNMSVPADARQTISSLVVPSLRVSGRDAPTRWAIFDVSFETPVGFTIVSRRINVGDIALDFETEKGKQRLLLRQVYPAKLALARRELAKWLKFPPFKDSRHFRSVEEVSEWVVNSFGRKLTGCLLRGHKCLSFPLRWLAPRPAIAAAVHDPELDRLLLADYDARSAVNEDLLKNVLGRMNWARLQPAEGV